MSLFKNILEEGFTLKKAKEEATPEETTTPEEETTPEETINPEESEESTEVEDEESAYTIQDQLKDLCFSVLDAVEAEALASGDDLSDDESLDVSTELIAKYAHTFSDETAKGMYDTLSEYFEMEVDETPEETEEYFEPEETEDETEYEEDKLPKEEK